MPAPKISEGDTVVLRAVVTRVSEDGKHITLRIPAYGYPITIRADSINEVERTPQKKTPPRDRAD